MRWWLVTCSIFVIRGYAISLAMLLFSSLSFAQDVREAGGTAGVAAYETGNYGDAVLAFQKSFFKKRQPNLAFNIAMSYERLKDLESAVDWYKQYRRLRSIDELGINRRIASLEGMNANNLRTDPKSSQSVNLEADINPFKATALGVGVVGLAAASWLDGKLCRTFG